MAIFAIGDIQGCFAALQRLLDEIKFDPSNDRLWFCGDLVNRGPDSLKTLRFVKKLGNSAVSVLGNHDLHLLALSEKRRKPKKRDTLYEVLNAPDREELVYWLRFRPLLYYENDYCLVHAGLPPQWNMEESVRYAKEVENIIRSDEYNGFLSQMYGDYPDRWSDSLTGWDRARFIVNCLTRLRYLDAGGRLDLEFKGPPGSQPSHLYPWFEAPNRKSLSVTIIYGHWSSLGFRSSHNCYGIDTGCIWGGHLTALRLEPGVHRTSINCVAFTGS